jgi:hypothetical protein
MTGGTKASGSKLPELIFYFALAMIAAGVVAHGAALSEFRRVWEHLLERPGGPLALRFALQPTMSTIFAVRDGLADARTGRSPYFWTVLSNPDERRARLREGVAATSKIMLLALLLDGAYQYIEFKTFYPVEALVVALCLAFVPYLLIRGPVARVARLSLGGR